jgi:3-phenylpropionate/trans-cinnamate dioxygenase ferredoxin reductase subunit
VTLVGAEPHLPYERPPLSKAYLRGEIPFEKTLVRPAAFYAQNNINTKFGVRVRRVDPIGRLVYLDTGTELQYDKLLIATGARNRRGSIPGSDLQNVYDLRSVTDADALRAVIRPGRRAVIIGMGFIGCEVAASLASQGVDVMVIDPSPAPLARILGSQVGNVLARVHRENGVSTIFEDTVTHLDGRQRVERVATRRGRRIECDFVVVGVGVEPVVDLVANTSIETNNAIVVDEYCHSSVEDVYAAGDVANHYQPLFERHIRVEHCQNAIQQGAAAARNMMGKRQTYDPIPWFWSDQYDLNLQYAGFHQSVDHVVIRGSLTGREFLAFYMNGGRIDAVAALNRGKDLRRVMPLIKSRRAFDPAQLANDDIDLRSLQQNS